MILSRKWLEDYVDTKDISNKEFCDAMTLSGSKVEEYKTEGSELENIVVGRIDSLERHPDSDHLWICNVNIGKGEDVQIVTGAQNLSVGDYVPAALPGATVYNRHEHCLEKIKKGKLRGVESNGMLCSFDELGLAQNDFPYAAADGIFILGEDCERTPGLDIHEAIGYNDTCVEFEITSNRSDCMSVTGLAREAAATFGREFRLYEPEVKPGHGDVNDHLKVQIFEPDKCYRYSGAVVENVRVKESPRWLRERLRASGVRPISNIVDITNYVMLEYGQPMHAFDLRYLEGNEVNVRNAKNGEKITTLDGVERELNDTMLVIADKNKPVAVAGVMGGEYSGIMDDTTTIVFESACFNGISVRRTAKALGMRTEASSRYEKELDPGATMRALKRALELVQELDAGDVVNGVEDCFVKPKDEVKVKFDYKWINDFIGIDLSEEKQKKILEKIEFRFDDDGNIIAPPFRNDIEHIADISEEVARFYGYHNIPNRQLSGVANGKLTDSQKFIKCINETLISCGCSEISTFSFISPKAYDRIRLAKDDAKRNSVVIMNPLGEDTSIMRTTILPSMLEVLARNYNHKNASASLYEIGTVYEPTQAGKLPVEKQKAVIGLYGNTADYYTLKGIVEKLLYTLNTAEYDIVPVSDNPTFHPGRTSEFRIGDQVLATLGEVHPEAAENYGIDERVYIAEIDVETAYENKMAARTHKALPKFPAVTRDLAFVCDRDIPVLTLEKEIRGAVGKTLESVKLFDVYEGEQIESGKKSVAFNIQMRSADKTLTDEEADAAMKRIVKTLGKMGISLRS
ncbi:MAG TPA: phenylalanine--tRNA ligase subunit beta [Candidatus Eubacterium faecavium]|nr:phenylalanine--tRNA ligase subunit beta [Candidatus Eubacterium faecavium]